LGDTGTGKSTFCHCITGSDPRVNKNIFLSENSNHSVTSKVEIIENLKWFD